MKIVKSIKRESLIKAGVMYKKAADRYSEIVAEYPTEKAMMNARPLDARDLINIAAYLKFKPIIDGTGNALSDEEYDAECRKLITAFANDDREQIFAYLDDWYKFAHNYSAQENIETVDDALKNFVYISSQQGISVTKLREYPDFYMSHYPDLDSMMKLQKMQSDISVQTSQEVGLFFLNGLQINSDSFAPFENATEEEMKKPVNMQGFEDFKESLELEATFSKAFIDGFSLDTPSPKDQVGVHKMVVPNELFALKSVDKTSREYKSTLDLLGNAVHASTGTTQTGFGLMTEYAGLVGTITNYRMIFIDGVCVYDSLPEPKSLEKANEMLYDALCNQTGVVTFAHVAHINNKFEYRIDVLDTRTGNNDNPEYVQKITALDNEEARKSLFASCAKKVSDVLEPAYKNYEKEELNKIAKAANEQIKKGAHSESDAVYVPPVTDRTGMNSAFFTFDEVRRQFLTYAKQYFVKHPDAKKSLDRRKLDERDFQDLFVFMALPHTLGIGERNLTPEETKLEAERMVDAFASENHDAIRPYLDRMYTYLSQYKAPKKLDNVDDWIKAVAYLRVQQTSVVKLLENPWYLEERFTTELAQSKFDAFEADYFVAYDDILRAIKRQTNLKLGQGATLGEIFQEKVKADAARADRAEDEAEYDDEQFDIDTIRSPYYSACRSVTDRRIKFLDKATTAEGNYTFKVKLPFNALSCAGEGVSDAKLAGEASNFYYEFIEKIYNPSYTESNLIRSYHFENKDDKDIMRLIFLDGKSVYDLVTEDGAKLYDSKAAKKLVFSSLINQTALVQFAHVMQSENGLSVELDTLDVSNKYFHKADYLQKLTDFEVNPSALHEKIKQNVNESFIEHKLAFEERIRSGERYNEEAKEQEAGILAVGDIFETEEAKEAPRQMTSEEDIRRRQAQSEEKRNEVQKEKDSDKAFAAAEPLDLSTFKNGRYSVPKHSPQSAFALASMSEMRNLEVYFGAMSTTEYPKDYISLVGAEDLEPSDNGVDSDARAFAELTGVKISEEQLRGVIYTFAMQNLSEDNAHVDRTIFERQYMILFGDLYIKALHSINKLSAQKGEAPSVEKMNDAINLLDKMMQSAAYGIGYPEQIFRGGFTPEGLKTLRNNFVEKFVPKTQTELALRQIQSYSPSFDFAKSDWKKPIGYTAFRQMINVEKGKLNKPDLWHYDNKLMAVQMVRAMEEYHSRRSRWSRFWNFRKSAKELSAIESFKTLLKTNARITDEDYAELYAEVKSKSLDKLKNNIDSLYQKDKVSAQKGEAIEESEYSFKDDSVYEEKELDNSVIHGMREDSFSESMDRNNESFDSEVSEKSEPAVKKISVEEAVDKLKQKPQKAQPKPSKKDLENKITNL